MAAAAREKIHKTYICFLLIEDFVAHRLSIFKANYKPHSIENRCIVYSSEGQESIKLLSFFGLKHYQTRSIRSKSTEAK